MWPQTCGTSLREQFSAVREVERWEGQRLSFLKRAVLCSQRLRQENVRVWTSFSEQSSAVRGWHRRMTQSVLPWEITSLLSEAERREWQSLNFLERAVLCSQRLRPENERVLISWREEFSAVRGWERRMSESELPWEISSLQSEAERGKWQSLTFLERTVLCSLGLGEQNDRIWTSLRELSSAVRG